MPLDSGTRNRVLHGIPSSSRTARIMVAPLPVYPVMETRVIMICGTLILAGSLMALQKPPNKAAPATAAERVTLRDGSVSSPGWTSPPT